MLRRVDGILVLVDSEVGAKEGREDGFWNREGGKGGVAVEIEERVVVVGRDANGADASFGELETRNRQITMRTENRGTTHAPVPNKAVRSAVGWLILVGRHGHDFAVAGRARRAGTKTNAVVLASLEYR